MQNISRYVFIVIALIALPLGMRFLIGTHVEFDGEGKEIGRSSLIEKVLGKRESITPPQKPLPNPPKIIRGIYLTAWSAGVPSVIEGVIEKSKNSEINAVVIDVKDFTGTLSYHTDIKDVNKYGASKQRAKDINGVIKAFHDAGIYVIARITAFQDPILALHRPDFVIHDLQKITSSTPISSSTVWLDNHGLGWIDPAAEGYWDYLIEISRDARDRGFDELNFDYIRFPSDDGIENTYFLSWNENSKREDAIETFFKYLRKELKGIPISADVFGQTTVTYGSDIGIGQIVEDAYTYFDAVAPMIYPSHYIKSFLGFENAAEHPYEVIHYSMDHAFRRLRAMGTSTNAVIRPWLQDFGIEGVEYTPEMVEAQIKAVKDILGDAYAGYLLWDPENTYTWEVL